MNRLKFKQIIYLISVTVVVTVAAQVYTNVENYRLNKQRFQLDVQQALDLALETYYADKAKNELIIFTSSPQFNNSLQQNRSITIKAGLEVTIDSATAISSAFKDGAVWKAYLDNRDSLRASYSKVAVGTDSAKIFRLNSDTISIFNQKGLEDSISLQLMAKKILSSLKDGSLDFDRLTEYLEKELDRKEINVDYQLIHKTPRKVFTTAESEMRYELSSFSKSTYLPKNQSLQIQYENASLDILKRGAFGLLISLLIILAVVGSLLYLYRVINEQKQLAEIKNDLISNITHEFKTPIATISTAIEGISLFNQTNDPEKTKKYLGISSDQLKKLNAMVEKLLETAALDSDDIEIRKESVEVVHMTEKLIEKFDLVKGLKSLHFKSNQEQIWAELDVFHIENAISNLIDNALKYGGDEVSVNLLNDGESLLWEVTDNGGKIEKEQQNRIFEKFYRIPTGNVHDVKGFGIGLYYTKVMVQKHGGTLNLKVSPGSTKFTIKI